MFVCFSPFVFWVIGLQKMTAVRMKKKRKNRCDERHRQELEMIERGVKAMEMAKTGKHVYQLVTVALCSSTGCRWLFTISSENRKENESWASAKCYG